MEEARLAQVGNGLAAVTEGWFVVNARDAPWAQPGEPNGYYHGEAGQEDFLVLSGECIAVVEGEERRLGQWDFLHCPPWTRHIMIGAGDGPCVVLMTGARVAGGIVYPVSEAAAKHGA